MTAANPELKMTEMSVKMGEGWRSLTEQEKAPFATLAAADKARYTEEMEAWRTRPEAR
jgi:hypothetical protein